MINFLEDKNISVVKETSYNTILNDDIYKKTINRKYVNKALVKNYIKDRNISKVDNIIFEIKYNKLNLYDVEDDISQIYKNIKYKECFKVFLYNNKVYVLVTRGEMNTGGYIVLINNIYTKDYDNNASKDLYEEIIIKVAYNNPPENCMCIQCFTYPYTIVETELDKFPNKVTFIVE